MGHQPTPDTLEALRQFDSATVSNAIEAFEVRDRTEGYTSRELRCQFPELPPMVGFAVTCTMDSTTPGPKRPSRRSEFFDAIAASPQPVVVVAQDVGPDRMKSCYFGDMVCAALQTLGAAGVVTDGGIRDVSGIGKNAPGLQVFAPGVVASHGNLVRLEINAPVTIGGLEVRPGDLLHGDENGIVKVPLDIAEAVAEQSRLVREREAKFFEYLRSPSVTMEGIVDQM